VGGLFVACLGACADDGNTSTFDGPAILFVTQVPSGSYGNVLSPFDNHEPFIKGTPRGGALMLRSGDGKLRNLTQEAGFGDVGMQGANAFAAPLPAARRVRVARDHPRAVVARRRLGRADPARPHGLGPVQSLHRLLRPRPVHPLGPPSA